MLAISDGLEHVGLGRQRRRGLDDFGGGDVHDIHHSGRTAVVRELLDHRGKGGRTLTLAAKTHVST